MDSLMYVTTVLEEAIRKMRIDEVGLGIGGHFPPLAPAQLPNPEVLAAGWRFLLCLA